MFFNEILDRISWIFDDFPSFFPTSDDSFSATSEPISKSLGIFNKYSPRAVDCAMFRRRTRKTSFSFSAMENRKFEILTLSSPSLSSFYFEQ